MHCLLRILPFYWRARLGGITPENVEFDVLPLPVQHYKFMEIRTERDCPARLDRPESVQLQRFCFVHQPQYCKFTNFFLILNFEKESKIFAASYKSPSNPSFFEGGLVYNPPFLFAAPFYLMKNTIKCCARHLLNCFGDPKLSSERKMRGSRIIFWRPVCRKR